MNPTLIPSPPSSPVAPPNSGSPQSGGEVAREQAIKQIQRRRQFHIELIMSAIVMLLVTVIWGTAEYSNAGGWPSNGFSQSSGIHDVWNLWIIYPFMA